MLIFHSLGGISLLRSVVYTWRWEWMLVKLLYLCRFLHLFKFQATDFWNNFGVFSSICCIRNKLAWLFPKTFFYPCTFWQVRTTNFSVLQWVLYEWSTKTVTIKIIEGHAFVLNHLTLISLNKIQCISCLKYSSY